jgi:hypothetical protein
MAIYYFIGFCPLFQLICEEARLYLLPFFFAINIRFFGRNRVDPYEKA